MNSFTTLAKIVAGVGAFLLLLGGLLYLASKVPGLGRLPGDIYVQRRNFTFYFPLATSLVLSLILSLFLYFLTRAKG